MQHHYMGASTSSPETPYEKIPFKTMQEKNLNQTHAGGWVAMQQHYFLSAWIPANATEKYHFYTHYQPPIGNEGASYTIGYLSPMITVSAGKEASVESTLYVGPESYSRLSALAPALNHTIDYGVLWPISVAIQWIMTLIVTVIPNWGVSIILATIIIKLLFYWFSSKSFISMAKMKELQPRIKALKERFGDDRMGLQKATMELYKEKKVNPLGGCLPMLIQIPVFIALFYVITQSVDFRQAPFMFWIQDLSVKDPYYVLPILMMLTMILQQWLSPTSADPAQAKMMMIMPIAFGFFFRNFPAGLVLYWCVNNLVQALQQWYVINRYKAGKYKTKDRQKNKRAFG
jgi:YidC/Oxa1 family membrane protein insertase